MSLRWQKLLGDTSRFAFKLSFQTDPDDGRYGTREQSLSWGLFEIWVRGQNLCAHIEEGEVIGATHWYLLPLLEWFVDKWEPLFHEEKLPVRNATSGAWSSLLQTSFPPREYSEDKASQWDAEWSDWWSRHCLQASRDGGLFPDVVIRRWRDQLEISWGPSELPGTPNDFRFLSAQGHAHIDVLDVVRPLYKVISEAVDFLLDDLPTSSRLKSLKQKLNAINEHRYEVRLAWLSGLGRDFDHMLSAWRMCTEQFRGRQGTTAVFDATNDALAIQGSCHAALMFGSVAPSIQTDDVLALARSLIDFSSQPKEKSRLPNITRDEPVLIGEKKIWDQGYQLAEETLEKLSLHKPQIERIDIEHVLSRLKISVKEIRLKDKGIRAVAVADSNCRAVVLANANNPSNDHSYGRRFTLAHEFCHVLFDRSYGEILALASGPWAPSDVEKRANAFAANFLMPAHVVRNAIAKLQDPLESLSGLRHLSRRLETSLNAVLEHLGNLGFIDQETRDKLRDELETFTTNYVPDV